MTIWMVSTLYCLHVVVMRDCVFPRTNENFYIACMYKFFITEYVHVCVSLQAVSHVNSMWIRLPASMCSAEK